MWCHLHPIYCSPSQYATREHCAACNNWWEFQLCWVYHLLSPSKITHSRHSEKITRAISHTPFLVFRDKISLNISIYRNVQSFKLTMPIYTENSNFQKQCHYFVCKKCILLTDTRGSFGPTSYILSKNKCVCCFKCLVLYYQTQKCLSIHKTYNVTISIFLNSSTILINTKITSKRYLKDSMYGIEKIIIILHNPSLYFLLTNWQRKQVQVIHVVQMLEK